MRAHVIALAAARKTELAIRIGLHSGEVVAGVIVSSASRTICGATPSTRRAGWSRHGQPGEIQLTGATRTALGTDFATRERGPIEVKGRGTITTYWLDG